MIPVLKFVLYLTKDSKTDKTHSILLKNWMRLFHHCLTFFSLNNTTKQLYVDVPEMFNFNSKTCFKKYTIP